MVDDSTTLRITNLSENTTDQDIHHLFGTFGSIQRSFLSKDDFGKCRGFAFVSFYSRRDAEKAMNKLNGHGYDNLILKVEWAK